MDLLEQTKEYARLHNIKPLRSRGQSFLIKEGVYNDIISASELTSHDRILEVGPGPGFLTEKLVQQARQVSAVEVDKKLYSALKGRLSEQKNLSLINADILKITPEDIFREEKRILEFDYKIVANLPYNISSIFLRRFLSEVTPPFLMVLMLQKEVAERIISTPPASVLSVMVQFYSFPEKIKFVPKENFWPSPKVDSAVVKLKVKKELPAVDESLFFDLVRKGFASRRKMLKNNLASHYPVSSEQIRVILPEIGVNENARAQDLYVENWEALLGYIKKYMI